jgi:hypothetical protein
MVATKADPKLMADNIAQMENVMRNLRHQAEREIDKKHSDPQEREALKAAASDLFDAIEATIKEGEIDGAASVNANPDSLTFVSGVHVKEPAKIEDALKKIETVAKTKPDFPGIKWNASNHAGVNFHTMSAPVPEDKAAGRKMFGETLDMTVGIGPDAVYVAFGKDNIAALEKAIDASSSDQSKKVAPFALSLSLGQIMAVAADAKEGPEKAALQAIANKLNGEAKGRDHIHVTGEVIPNGLRYRFAAEEGALQAVGIAAKMKQQARNGQQPGN